jgi:hypothetical protein
MLTPAANSLIRRIRGPGYLLFLSALILPLIDFLIQIYPYRMSTVVWRFAAVATLSGAIAPPVLILFLIFVLATMSGDRKVLLTIGVVCSLLALLLIGSAGSFALDALQMKQRVQEAAQTKYLASAGQALFKLLVQTLCTIVLAVSSFRATRAATSTLSAADQRASAGLVMGRRAGTIRPGAADVPTAVPAPLDD